MNIGLLHGLGILVTIATIACIGLYSGKRVKNTNDFTVGGGKAGRWIVCGTIMGSLVSGHSTIGTAQLAFTYGITAWWFTLGSGIGCLFLALAYSDSLRRSKCITVLEIVSHEYGKRTETIASVLGSIGIFISVLAQIVGCSGLITVLVPSLSVLSAVVIAVVLMCVYVVFGGAWSAGMGGVIKLILLYAASVAGFVLVLHFSCGPGALFDTLINTMIGRDIGSIQSESVSLNDLLTVDDICARYLNMFARGIMKDAGSCVSLILGVLSTQTYAQAIFSARTDQEGKRGALLSACLIPPIGIAGTMIGLYMRGTCLLQSEADALLATGRTVPHDMTVLASTIQVFPEFVVQHMPGIPGGIVLGTLLVTIVGGGAGLSLGVATIITRDILPKSLSRDENGKRMLVVTRITILMILIAAGFLAVTMPGTMINDLGFLSMGFRGTAVFIPLTCSLFLPGKIKSKYAIAAVVTGPIVMTAGKLLGTAIDPMFIGIFVEIVIMTMGYCANTGNTVAKE